MKYVRQILLPLLIFVAFPCWPDQLIIEPDMGRQPLLNAINKAHHSLQLVMYGWTDTTLLDAIIQKKNAGQTINIILEESPYKAANENNKTITVLNTHHIEWRNHIPPFRLIHQKTLLIDGQKAIIMTFNFTHSTFKNERNFALMIDDDKRVQAIKTLFSADWNRIPYLNTTPNVIVSPDDSRNKLMSLIHQAKLSIQIYAQNINDYKIVGALAKAAKQGIHVQVLTSTHLRQKQSDYLARSGVTIRYSRDLIIHAKVLIIDRQKAVLGSINLTRASLDDNRELAVISEDPTVLKQLSDTFTHDWESADLMQPRSKNSGNRGRRAQNKFRNFNIKMLIF